MNPTIITALRAAALLAINLLFLMVWGFTGIGKVIDGPPAWFPEKFGATMLAKFPGLAATFWLLAIGEVLAFGLAAASFFPALFLGIFSKRMNHYGAISGMVSGIGFTVAYIGYFKFLHPELNDAESWWLGISPEGIGALGMVINFLVAIGVSSATPPPSDAVQKLVEDIRVPTHAGAGHELSL